MSVWGLSHVCILRLSSEQGIRRYCKNASSISKRCPWRQNKELTPLAIWCTITQPQLTPALLLEEAHQDFLLIRNIITSSPSTTKGDATFFLEHGPVKRIMLSYKPGVFITSEIISKYTFLWYKSDILGFMYETLWNKNDVSWELIESQRGRI